MKTKRALVVAVLLVVLLGTVFAASRGGIGVVGYTNWANLTQENDQDAYKGGIRGEFFLNDYLGISADAMMLASDADSETYVMMYMFDAIGRLPLGMLEPYVALGPGYIGTIIEGEADMDSSSFGFNVRGGVDFNILKNLSLGIEANFFVEDLANVVDEIQAQISENTLIGITIKYKF